MSENSHYKWFSEIGREDVALVGGKNSSLGEMYQHLREVGVTVPNGFATTSEAYMNFLNANKLLDKIKQELSDLDVTDVKNLQRKGKNIRTCILEASFTDDFTKEITDAYNKLMEKSPKNTTFAVRSSATAEDLPTASFAGQQETYLNVDGIEDLLNKIKLVFASLFTDRAISYRDHHKFEHLKIAISVGVQRMIRSDLSASGVIFTLDTESGYPGVVYITSSYGLGEAIVQGSVNPDEFYVDKKMLSRGKNALLQRGLGDKDIKMIYANDGNGGIITVDVDEKDKHKFSLTEEEVLKLADLAVKIENHYKMPMDIEWAKDGKDGNLYILQARPETVKSRKSEKLSIVNYSLKSKSKVLAVGRSVGTQIVTGKACVMSSLKDMNKLQQGDILITDMTDPDWEPIMKKSGAIITNRGGRTCHAAIVARELGIPAVVGCRDATENIKDGIDVTISCAKGDEGIVYEGVLEYDRQEHSIDNLPTPPVKIMLNIGNPERAFYCHDLPNEGVGLARLEFIINNQIGIHPNAILNIDTIPKDIKEQILKKTSGYKDPIEFYRRKLAEGIATIASVFYPKPVIVRLSDFKSNEYANLLGGAQFEPEEDNPMIGFRGASRYVAESFKPCFELECQAMLIARNEMGLDNIQVMIPFVRTVEEGKNAIGVLNEFGIKQEDGIKIIMMCEIPSNIILAEEFLEHFDGFSIGSNDLTQLTLGVDRDSESIAYLFDERNLAVKRSLEKVIKTCLKLKKYIGICGQGPSDYPDFAAWLLEQKIESMSLNPDSVIEATIALSKKE